jgi:hypothetical protein
MTEQPQPGQLRGIGLRLDPQGILFRPFEENGLQWGYTLKPEEGQPALFMNDEWTEFVPEGVWLQMLDLWAQIGRDMKANIDDVQDYLEYPEVKRLVDKS